MSVNSRLKAICIIVQVKAFYRQIVPESLSARKETVDIEIFATSGKGDRKIMQSIRIKSRPPPTKNEVEPVQPVQMNIYQSNTNRKGLSWLHFPQWAKGSREIGSGRATACIFISVGYPKIPSSK